MAIEKPTVLLIHGSWHSPVPYQKILDLLKAEGFPALCPQLPSHAASPPIGLMEDAQCIRDALHKLVDEEKKQVIVAAHSYGGAVASQAVDAEFGLEQRKEKGLEGGVINLLYITAFVLAVGESLGSALGGGPAPDTKMAPFIPADKDGMCIMEEPGRRFYNDLSNEDRAYWVSKLVKCPIGQQLTPITFAAHLHHPVTYLVCEKDEAIPAFIQRKMVEDARKENSAVIVEICSAGHSPFLSQPEEILRVVQRIAG